MWPKGLKIWVFWTKKSESVKLIEIFLKIHFGTSETFWDLWNQFWSQKWLKNTVVSLQKGLICCFRGQCGTMWPKGLVRYEYFWTKLSEIVKPIEISVKIHFGTPETFWDLWNQLLSQKWLAPRSSAALFLPQSRIKKRCWWCLLRNAPTKWTNY